VKGAQFWLLSRSHPAQAIAAGPEPSKKPPTAPLDAVVPLWHQFVIRRSRFGFLMIVPAREPPWAVTPEKLREAIR
jgi:hypothetical protein